MSSKYRSHRVAELKAEHVGQNVVLAGWIERKRSMGSLVFVELRDAGALVQCVVEAGSAAFDALSAARLESVVTLSGAAARPRRFFDELAELARQHGAAAFSYLVLGDVPKGPLSRLEQAEDLMRLASARAGDALLLLAGPARSLNSAAGALRSAVADRLELVQHGQYRFAWIVDFPMYCRDETSGKLEFLHNPFSMPQGGMAALAGDPEAVLAHQYDIVCNGVELSSGAIRNHRPDVMLRAFELAGYGADDVERRFGAMLSAFKFGAPPHGGLAPGIDRGATKAHTGGM